MKIDEFNIVFIGGIHGVGKSVFAEKASETLKIPCLSASKLIAEQRKVPAAINKRVHDVAENQGALIEAIESNPISSKQFFLDGHFCVLDTLDSVQKVPLDTFKALSPIAVIVLLDDVKKIQERLQNRDKKEFNYELLARLQEAELDNANEVCAHLKIPMCQSNVAEYEKALRFAAGHFNFKVIGHEDIT